VKVSCAWKFKINIHFESIFKNIEQKIIIIDKKIFKFATTTNNFFQTVSKARKKVSKKFLNSKETRKKRFEREKKIQ
jgi:hypothetical protein